MSSHEAMDNGNTGPLSDLLSHAKELEEIARVAKRNGFRISSHPFYDRRARIALVELHKDLQTLKRKLGTAQDGGVAGHLEEVEALINELRLERQPAEILSFIQKIHFKVNVELSVNLSTYGAADGRSGAPFVPAEIIGPGVYRKVLEEANACFENGCFNACAAMFRRLVESLIIEAFETHRIEHRIKYDGEYMDLKALIGKATAEPALKLSRNTKGALPKLKVLGDLSVHSRKHLVRCGDLEKLHGDIRITIEELSSCSQHE